MTSALLSPVDRLLDARDLAPMLDHLAERLVPAHRFYLGLHEFPQDLEEIAGPVFRLRHDAGLYDEIARTQIVNAAAALRADTCQCEHHMALMVSRVIGQLHDAARRIRKAHQW